MSPHVVVVGGGIAGLAAAHRLVASGADVTVLEADRRLGGKLRTTAFAGRLVDEGADSFLLRVPWGIELCRDLGIEAELVNPAARNAYVWSHGALRPLPPQMMGVPTDLDALAASGLVSPAGVERAREDLAGSNPILGADATVAEAIGGRLGTEVVERLVDPLVGGINAGDTRRLSVRTVSPQVAAALDEAGAGSLIETCRALQHRAAAGPDAPLFAGPAAGMGHLVDVLAASLAAGPGAAQVRTGRCVNAIERHGNGWVLAVDDDSVECDAVVVAVPGHAGGPLLQPITPAAGALTGVEHASVAMVTLAFDPDSLARPLDASGFLVPRVEATEALTACSWTSSKWAHQAPEIGDGTVVVRASAGRAGDHRALDLDDDGLVAALLRDLERTMAVSGGPRELRITRWDDSLPQYAPGHLDRIAELEAALPRTVVVAGAALRGVGVPACIRSGREAADALLAALGAAR